MIIGFLYRSGFLRPFTYRVPALPPLLLCTGLLWLTTASQVSSSDLVVAPDSVTPTVVELVTTRTAIAVASVTCDENVPLRQGVVFKCVATGTEGTRIVVTIELEDDEGGFFANVIDPLAIQELAPRTRDIMAGFISGHAAAVYEQAGPEIRDSISRNEFVTFIADRIGHLGGLEGEAAVEAAFVNRAQGEGRLLVHYEFENGALTGNWVWRREGERWELYGLSFRDSLPGAAHPGTEHAHTAD